MIIEDDLLKNWLKANDLENEALYSSLKKMGAKSEKDLCYLKFNDIEKLIQDTQANIVCRKLASVLKITEPVPATPPPPVRIDVTNPSSLKMSHIDTVKIDTMLNV